jgi:hypothetical protein
MIVSANIDGGNEFKTTATKITRKTIIAQVSILSDWLIALYNS